MITLFFFIFTPIIKLYLESINRTLSTKISLDLHPQATQNMFSNIRTLANTSVGEANTGLSNTYTALGQIVTLAAPVTEGNISSFPHVASLYDAYWYHSDHLGSSSYITNLNGVVTQHMEYLPYGETLVDEHQNSYNTPFKFNAKELDSLSRVALRIGKETGNYYYGARYYNPKWSFWLNVDPLAEKYPGFSPYVYVYNNPLNFIDPDGREGIVVSGSPGNHKNKKHFLENGLSKAISAQSHFQRDGEKTTWIVYNGSKNGYTEKQLKTYRARAEKAGITMKVVSSADDIVDYVNNKSGGESRSEDKITSFYYVGHSTPGDLDVGWSGTGENFEPDDFSSDAFSSGTHVNVVGGCNTAISDTFEDSVLTQFQEILDNLSNIYGSNVSVGYMGGVMSDEQLVKYKGTDDVQVDGEIIHRTGELPSKVKE
jgi:RHS repeat-associated protein